MIDILPEQKLIEGLGGNMRLGGKEVELKPDTLASRLFDNAKSIHLRFRPEVSAQPVTANA